MCSCLFQFSFTVCVLGQDSDIQVVSRTSISLCVKLRCKKCLDIEKKNHLYCVLVCVNGWLQHGEVKHFESA